MGKLKLVALLLGAILFTGIGAISLSAEEMKCGAGKCGASMDTPVKKMKCGAGKCGSAKGLNTPKCMCGDNCPNKENCAYKKDASKACDCVKKGSMKCGAGKCGGN
ncbi:MAG: hypothetical protein U9N39_01320 [Campylobacterota bacterium]|nr:hypothetical protein [Campylobacterota bacterium]